MEKNEVTNISLRECKTKKKNVKGVFVTDKTDLKIIVLINAMILALITFVTNTPICGKIDSKV